MHTRSPTRLHLSLYACLLTALLPTTQLGAQQPEDRDCVKNRVAWRSALEQAWKARVPECQEAKQLWALADGDSKNALLQLPMTLECAAAIHAERWKGSYSQALEVFQIDGSSPSIALNVIGADGVSSPSRDFRKYLRYWVTRQSPHFDANVLVCDQAQVWIEVAVRPRIRVGDWSGEAATLRASASLPVLGFPVEAMVFGSLEQRFPKPGSVLEPWQSFVFAGAGKQPVVEPPRPSLDPPAPDRPLPAGSIAPVVAADALLCFLQRRTFASFSTGTEHGSA
jgi:hypothetical protein